MQELEYTISKYIPDTVTLESMWSDLHVSQNAFLVRSVADALKILQEQLLTHETTQDLLVGTPWLNESGTRVFGGPSVGYFNSLADFLM